MGDKKGKKVKAKDKKQHEAKLEQDAKKKQAKQHPPAK